MEFEVSHVGGIENCYASLPLQLIQTLESTCSGSLPQVLCLELRSLSNDGKWVMAWSGAISSSSVIEVAQQFAECISLPDHRTVQVRAISNVPKATLVTIEPHSEDDWEVLELNAEHAEAAILNQVCVVHEGMRFPLWLHGRTIATFLVVSTFPKNVVVQLGPGSEFAVAPKRRMEKVNKYRRFIQKSDVKGVELGVVLTTVAYVHPETAKKYSLDALQLVSMVPRLSSKESIKTNYDDVSRTKNNSTPKEADNEPLTGKKESRQVIVRILVSDSVAKGHVMIAQPLRLYLRAGLHSWDGKALEKSGLEVLENLKSRKSGSILQQHRMDIVNWSVHDKVLAALGYDSTCEKNDETEFQRENRKGLQCLLHAWFLAQLDAISSYPGISDSLIVGNETLIQFEVRGWDLVSSAKVEVSSDSNSLINRNKTSEEPVELLYVMTISEDLQPGGKVVGYKFTFERNSDKLQGLDLLAEKLKFGEPISLYTVKDRKPAKSSSNISSLNWMGTSTSDVINSRNNGPVISFIWDVVQYLQPSTPWTCFDIWTSWFWKDCISKSSSKIP
ncbi:putative peroxisome biogenesis factor [Tripterygium wilfordii]|uniref:Putative peroxisome biogenesis factor n=1 Tax=Tripterygium wilfordii TaxID=458696 RepID=A0A7J7CN77_TRIWF|nr:putative peroxisome biogenesis factor [Tripterygium wilfordii]